MSNRPQAILLLGLVGCLLALTVVRIYDPDFGFYLAIGNQTMAAGIPQTEFFVPLLGEQPFSSLHLLSSLILALSWKVTGPAGFILVKATCYTSAFLLAALAAIRRGAPPLIATTVAAVTACAVAARFVERPGMFSAAFLAVLIWGFSGNDDTDPPVAKSPNLSAVLIVLGSIIWSWMHAEWYLGIFALGCLLVLFPMTLPRRAAILSLSVALPLHSFLALHPGGLKPILEPLSFIGGGAAERFAINEYSHQLWKLMPLAIPLLLIQLCVSCSLLKQRRWGEAVLIGVLALLCLKIPRAALPALLVGIPWCSEILAKLLESKLPDLRALRALAIATIFLIAGLATTFLLPGRTLGLSLDPTLDMRGVGNILGRITESEDPILSEFARSSALLSQPSAVRQGIVMDGRQEAYRGNDAYIDQYAQMLTPGYWESRPANPPVAFYFEPFPSSRELGKTLITIGWELLAWDESGRLFARPGIAEKYELPTRRFDPAYAPVTSLPETIEERGAWIETVQAAEAEFWAVAVDLQVQGFPSTRALIIAARTATLNPHTRLDPAAMLDRAKDSGGERYYSWWQAMAAAHPEDREAIIEEANRRFSILPK